MIHIRRATNADTRAMADLLNEIISIGGTTAITDTITAQSMQSWLASGGPLSAWHVAETDAGEIKGFQLIEPHEKLPREAVDIATFVRAGQTGLGIGSRLFDATRAAAVSFGYDWINASIRSDNTGGLAYYQSRGFRDWDHSYGVALSNGLIVDKTHKRFDLD